jgi:cyanophycin synthetase
MAKALRAFARLTWTIRDGSTSTTPTASAHRRLRPQSRRHAGDGRLSSSACARRVGRTIGVVSIPGDRRDEDIREMGEIAAALFDELVFRERPDGRGRASGSVVALLSEGALSKPAFPRRTCIACSARTRPSTLGLRHGPPGDLVMLFPTSVEAVWRQVETFQPAANAVDAGLRQDLGGAVA